jgi:replicative DNA helicase
MSDALPPPPSEPPSGDDLLDVSSLDVQLRGAANGSGNGSANGSGRGGRSGYDRVPPHSLEAEVSVLGAALLSPSAATEVVNLLKPEDFYRSAHGAVFEAIVELVNVGVDAVTVLEWLNRHGRLEEIGGPGAIHELTAAVPTAANAVHYANIVKEKALLRRLIDVGTDVTRLGYEATEDARTVVDQAESMIYEIAEHGTKSDYAKLSELLNESFEMIEKLAENRSEVTGLPTGFNDLDRLTAGLQPQNLIIIAARPAMGKCLVGSARVALADGRVERIDDLVRRGASGGPVEVLALDEQGTVVPAEVSEFHDNGERDVLRLRTRSGHEVVATPNHPLLTPRGWVHVEDLEPGDLVATPRRLPVAGTPSMSEDRAKLLGYLLGDGSFRGPDPTVTTAGARIDAELERLVEPFAVRVRRNPKRGNAAWTVAFVNDRPRVRAEDVATAVGRSTMTVGSMHRGDGVVAMSEVTLAAVEDAIDELGYTGRAEPNELRTWLEELGLWGLDSHAKHVPDAVHRLPDGHVAGFLSRLYACDGSAWVARQGYAAGISYTTVSDRLARDVHHLLLRLGIVARIRRRRVRYVDPSGRQSRRTAFELEIRDAENCRRFLDRVGIFSKEEACARVRDVVERRRPHNNVDLLPVDVWDRILAAKGDRTWADVSEATGRPRNHNWHVGRRRPSRRTVAELADALDDVVLRQAATDDVLWDAVVSVEPAGRERVYDITVPRLHNFVADGLIVHNSSLSLNLAQYVTVELRRPAIIFSLEMSKIEIVNRMLSSEARIDSSKIKTGRLEDADWRKLGDALGRLSEAPLFIDDTPSITLMEIRAKSRRLKQKHGLDLVIVDYLQLMQSHRRVDNRQQEVAEISRGLKMLAKELDVPVIALSQLSRQPESRTDKRPQLADLRESGASE